MEKVYHLTNGKKPLGHYTLAQIQKLELKDSYQVWTDENEDWKNILEFEELKNYVIKTPPPIKKQESKASLYFANNPDLVRNLKYSGICYLVSTILIFLFMGGLSDESVLIAINNSVEKKIYFTDIMDLRMIMLYTSLLLSIAVFIVSYFIIGNYYNSKKLGDSNSSVS